MGNFATICYAVSFAPLHCNDIYEQAQYIVDHSPFIRSILLSPRGNNILEETVLGFGLESRSVLIFSIFYV